MPKIFDDTQLVLEARRSPPRTSMVEVSSDLRVAFADETFPQIFNFESMSDMGSVDRVVRRRSELGWTNLSEVILGEDPVETRISELRSSDFLQTYQVSRAGDIVRVTHFKDHARDRTLVLISEVQVSLKPMGNLSVHNIPSCLLLLSMSDQYQHYFVRNRSMMISAVLEPSRWQHRFFLRKAL